MNQPNYPKQQGSGMFDSRANVQGNLAQQDAYGNGMAANRMMDGMTAPQQNMENANKGYYYNGRNPQLNTNWSYNSEQDY